MKLLNNDLLDQVLHHLNNILEMQGSVPINIVVCGGSSLIATGLIARSTRDVDVMAIVSSSPEGRFSITPSKPFPDFLADAAGRVSRDFSLDTHWLNADTSSITKDGLPDGFQERFFRKKYGNVLTVDFIGRYDQIHLKLYAASFPDERHLQDLITLQPTEDETEAAARWTCAHWTADNPKREICKEIVRELGYEAVAGRI